MNDNTPIGFIGFGNMGQALGGAMAKRCSVSLVAVEPYSDRIPMADFPSLTITDANAVFNTARLIFLAIKPQQFQAVSADLAPLIQPHHRVVSMLAGVTVQQLQHALKTPHVVRIMPNTPAVIGDGVTGVYFSPAIHPDDQAHILTLCRAVGLAVTVENESHMDVITALSGSGPAFYYRLIDGARRFAVEQGLDPSVALDAVLQTMKGSAGMVARHPDPSALIQAVASPGGTTQAGLTAMDHHRIDDHWQATFMAALRRSQELSKGVTS